MAKIVCIVPRREMADQASLLAANMHIDDFSVIFAETEEIPTLAKSLAGVGIDVIIARGAQALMLRELCDIPIVEIRITAQEMGLLIRRSKSILNIPEPKIGVIGHVNMFCDMSSFDYLYGIKLHTYYADVTSDLSALAEAAYSDGMDILLGGDAVCQTASMHSVPSLFLTSGTESLSEAMRNAKNVAYACDLEKNNTAEVKALLDYSFSGIIKLDRDGHILRMNHLAEKILGGRESEFLGSKMADVVPAFSSAITDVLGGEDVYSAVYSVRDTPVVINMAPKHAI